MIEIHTKNGYRQLISCDVIVGIGELQGRGGSNSVITLESGEVVFVANTYDNVKEMYAAATNSLEETV